MGNLLKRGVDWLNTKAERGLYTRCVYFRGTSSCGLRATHGTTVFEIDTGNGLLQRFETHDFLFAIDDLLLDGTLSLPRRGDRIEEDDGVTLLTYEVKGPGKEPCYALDPTRKRVRVHTTLIVKDSA